jgi:hypothetical protein
LIFSVRGVWVMVDRDLVVLYGVENKRDGYYLTLPVLCNLLKRQPDPLRKSYLKPLAERSDLTMGAFPRTPIDSSKAYTSTWRTGNLMSDSV